MIMGFCGGRLSVTTDEGLYNEFELESGVSIYTARSVGNVMILQTAQFYLIRNFKGDSQVKLERLEGVDIVRGSEGLLHTVITGKSAGVPITLYDGNTR